MSPGQMGQRALLLAVDDAPHHEGGAAALQLRAGYVSSPEMGEDFISVSEPFLGRSFACSVAILATQDRALHRWRIFANREILDAGTFDLAEIAGC